MIAALFLARFYLNDIVHRGNLSIRRQFRAVFCDGFRTREGLKVLPNALESDLLIVEKTVVVVEKKVHIETAEAVFIHKSDPFDGFILLWCMSGVATGDADHTQF